MTAVLVALPAETASAGKAAGGGILAGRRAFVALGDLIEPHIAHRMSLRLIGIGSARNHRSHLSVFARVLADVSATEVRSEHVERWLGTRGHLKASTRRSQLSTVRTFCAWLVRSGYLLTDPCMDVASPRLPRSVCRAFVGEDVGALLEFLPDVRAEAIVWLMLGMGLRCCEVHNLEIADWDRRSEAMTVRGKGSHERVVAVPDEVATAVLAYLGQYPTGSGPMIRSYRRPSQALTADAISGMVSEWMRHAGIKRAPRDGVSAHALRATAASDVFENSKDVVMVQEILGHVHLNTTQIYLRRPNLTAMHKAMSGRPYRARPKPAQPSLFED